MSEYEQYEIGEAAEGMRLDKALMSFKPDTGLRYRRRLCDDGHVLVAGKTRKPGYKVRAGQEISIAATANTLTYKEMGLRAVTQGDDFAAVYKPACVHSAAVAGADSASVESVLPDMFADAEPVLLNRLDYLTSGLLLVALNDYAESEYHRLEDRGDIQKFYLAEVRGRLDGITTVRAELGTDNRKRTKVLAESEEDERRWTTVESLSHDHEKDTTLVNCLIMKGSRHQIRVHLATIGFPIVGDPLYGDGKDGEVLHLHHQRVELPGFTAEIGVEWD